jgi:hypothetical protein
MKKNEKFFSTIHFLSSVGAKTAKSLKVGFAPTDRVKIQVNFIS